MSQPAVSKGIEGLALRSPRLFDQVHDAICRLHYSRRTEEAYAHWIKRFIIWSGKRHPAGLGEPEVGGFLSYLASERNVAAATQNQAFAALLFLYKQVLGRDLAWLDSMVRAKRPVRLPVVLSPLEAGAAGYEQETRGWPGFLADLSLWLTCAARRASRGRCACSACPARA